MDCLLPESLDISTVLDTTVEYRSWLVQQTSLHIDGSHVHRVDAAGLQALAALFLSAKNNQINIQLMNPTQPVIDGATILGLAETFDLNS